MSRISDLTATRPALRQALAHPVRVVVGGFLTAIAVGTALLLLPVASTAWGSASPLTALFTATSGICVTGLVVVDTAEQWSTFGEVVILALIQVGGLGVMTLAALVALLIGHRLGIRASMLTEAESRGATMSVAGAGQVVRGVLRTSPLFEAFFAIVLTLRLRSATSTTGVIH